MRKDRCESAIQDLRGLLVKIGRREFRALGYAKKLRQYRTELRWESQGWWVPAVQFYQQKVFPITGSWQKIRRKNGDIVEACILAGYSGWHDGNYEPITGVSEWMKPARWFSDSEDMIGDLDAINACKSKQYRSPLRKVASTE